MITEQKRPQQRRKTEFILKSFQKMGVQAVGIGEGESALGLEWLFNAGQLYETPFVASNLKCEEIEFPTVQLEQFDGLNLGIVSLLRQTTSIEGCEILPVESTLKSIFSENPSVDVWVSLSMLNEGEQKELSSLFPELDFIVDGYTKALLDEPIPLENDALRLSMGSRGKFIGFLDVTTKSPSKGYQLENGLDYYIEEVERLQQRLDTLKSKEPDDEKARARQERRVSFFEKELIKAEAMREEQKQKKPTGNTVSLRKRELSKSVPNDPDIYADLNETLLDIERLASSQEIPVYDGPFVGASACQGCHSEIYAQWAGTPHAHAWTTLVNEKRSLDLECYACHSTGAHHPEGPQHPKQLGVLVGVGCESCHGAGKDHITKPETENIIRKPAESVCVTCHDGVKDEGRFDFSSYYPKVVHSHENSGN